MTNVKILSVFRKHAQKEYSKVLEMKATHILNILALLFFQTKQCIYSKSCLNGISTRESIRLIVRTPWLSISHMLDAVHIYMTPITPNLIS